MHYWKKLTTLQKALAAIVVVVLFAIGVMSARAEGVDRGPPSFLPIGEVAKATNWSGVYVGGHGGYGWSDSGLSVNDGFDSQVLFPGSDGIKSEGWLGGALAGAQYQSGHWVFGIEADVAWIDGDGDGFFVTQKYIDNDGKNGTSWSENVSIDKLGTVRGRLGYAVNNVLFYGTGGWAWADVDMTHAVADGANAPHAISNVSRNLTGYAAGAGLEVMLASNLSLRGEYLYINLGRESFGHDVGNKSGDPDLVSSDLDMHVVRGALTYRFGGK